MTFITSFPKHYITPVDLVEDWLAVLDARSKRLEVVEEAGHLNLYESPARFIAFREPLRAS